ncbi:MAG: hypothetical protein ACRDL3_03150, partial [Solirubrobacterales bacterium]
PEVAGEHPVVACIAVLEGKSPAAVISALAPVVAHAICTELAPETLAGLGRPGAATVPATTLAELCGGAGLSAEAVTDPRLAMDRTLAVARERAGVALFTGSHYLLGYPWTERRAPSSWR